MDETLLKNITISALPELSCRERLSLEGWTSSIDDLIRIGRGEMRGVTYRSDDALQACERARKLMTVPGIRILHISDPEYPPALREIYNPPYMLYLRGELPDQDIPAAGIWGGVHPGSEASKTAGRFGRGLRESGISYVWDCRPGVSLACFKGYGEGAVAVCSEPSVFMHSVLPDFGISLVCEYPPGVPGGYESQRIVTGMVRSLCFLAAPWDRLTEHAAECALDEGRDVCVHASSVHSRIGKRLVEEGAVVLSSIQDLLELWE